MNPVVAMMIASLSCTDPSMTFRDFFGRYYLSPARPHWAGREAESFQSIVTRVLDATADYQDYRAARLDKCGPSR